MTTQPVALITGATGQDGAYLVGILAQERIYRPWHQTSFLVLQHRAGWIISIKTRMMWGYASCCITVT